MRLQDKVAIITGAGSGIAEVAARLFAREGAAVMIADINQHAAESVAVSINAEGGRAAWTAVDVTSSTSAEEMVQVTLNSFGRVDLLFNNAGIEGFGSVIEADETSWDRIFAVHVRGGFLCSKYAIRAMIDGWRARALVNVSPVSGPGGLRHISASSPAK